MAAHALRDGLSTLRRGTGAVLFSAALLTGGVVSVQVAAAPAATADECPGGWGGQQDGGGADVCGSTGEEETTPGSGSPGSTKIPIPGPWTQRVYVPYCDQNSVDATGPGVSEYQTIGDVLCGGFSSCPSDEDNAFWAFERPMSAENRAPADDFEFDRAGRVCRSPDDPRESEPPTITVADIMEQARAAAPTPSFVIEPAAKSYVNVPTNFAADVSAVTVNVTVLGFTIPVDFTPGDVTWSFGDGNSGTGVGVRNASVGQSGAVEHVYGRSGAYDVTMTVGYNVQINLPTGPLTFPTPINRTAPAQALEVGEIQSVVTEVD